MLTALSKHSVLNVSLSTFNLIKFVRLLKEENTETISNKTEDEISYTYTKSEQGCQAVLSSSCLIMLKTFAFFFF